MSAATPVKGDGGTESGLPAKRSTGGRLDGATAGWYRCPIFRPNKLIPSRADARMLFFALGRVAHIRNMQRVKTAAQIGPLDRENGLVRSTNGSGLAGRAESRVATATARPKSQR